MYSILLYIFIRNYGKIKFQMLQCVMDAAVDVAKFARQALNIILFCPLNFPSHQISKMLAPD